MPAAKRTFVFALADAYKLGRELIDQEPNTSVMIRRRVDTRVPTPLLSSTVSQPVAKPSFGGLANLRAGPSTSGAGAAAAVSATGTGAWGRSSSPATAPSTTPASASFAAASTARPNHLPTSAAGPSLSAAGSANATPRPSRPVTPVAPIVRAGARAAKVGEVGKVEDDDWDQSGDEA